jgi:hypothetical protein
MNNSRTYPPAVVVLARSGVECRQWSNVAIIDEATDHRAQDTLVHLRCDTLAVDTGRLRHKYARSPKALQVLDTAGDAGP